MMRCSSCGVENSTAANFCEECGTKLAPVCPQCGCEVKPSAKFCRDCGTPLKGKETGNRGNGESGKNTTKVISSQSPVASSFQLSTPQTADFELRTLDARRQTRDARREGERRQLTVMFCDLVGSTALAEQLDPEEFHKIVRAYQETCAEIIRRFGGYIAQYLGDGLLVYFGYPAAHEEDAQRAVRTGLEIIAALPALSLQVQRPVHVRVGIHTGPVVVGEIGGGDKREHIALGETPNIAARLQGLAGSDEVLISAATYQLVAGFFEYQPLGPQKIKGLSTPLSLHRVVGVSSVHNRFEVSVRAGLTPLVGREEELGLLLKCWEKAKEGEGQVVLLSGEPGIGKSRLVQELRERVGEEGQTRLMVPSGHRIEYRCSPVHQNSTFYPVIDLLRRVLRFRREDSPEEKLGKLERLLKEYSLPLHDTVPLFASLLSLPQPDHYPPLNVSPQRQKQKLQEALIAWLLEETERRAVLLVWEDLQWADPSTLELLHLIVEQVPAAHIFMLLTFRPEFLPPWGLRPYMNQLQLTRLGHARVEEMVEKVTGGKSVPAEVVQQITSKTDGVPLFVEELTKMVMESGFLKEVEGRYELTGPLPFLAIPASLQDSLMARLDRLATVREIAQLGAVLGREFSYELIHAVSRFADEALQQGLSQLVEAELLYQRGRPPQSRYIFKHALIQETAYQSLLKSKRQQVHLQVAQVLGDQFAETAESQPEILAHHYTEAGVIDQALPYWRRAGQKAYQRSANLEAANHLNTALGLLQTLPETPERTQQEITLRLALGGPLIAAKGYAAAEVEDTYARALELCHHVGEIPQLFPVLWGLFGFYLVRAEFQKAREIGEQLLRMAQRTQNPTLCLEASLVMGQLLFHLGEFGEARTHLERGIALYDPQKHRPDVFRTVQDAGVSCLSYAAWSLWLLGYPDQALARSREALTLAQKLAHPLTLAWALNYEAGLHHLRIEKKATRERAEAAIQLAADQGFPFWVAMGTMLRGWALTEQAHGGERIAQIRRGLLSWQAMGAELGQSSYFAVLAEAYGEEGQAEAGLDVLTKAFAHVNTTGERWYEAELYRLKGELTLQKLSVASGQLSVTNPQSLIPNTQHPAPSSHAEAEAEACFQKAIEIARRQQAKSLELRATMSLSRLWQQQGKTTEARQLLGEVHSWFTEGFDSQDLREAVALLTAFGGSGQERSHENLS